MGSVLHLNPLDWSLVLLVSALCALLACASMRAWLKRRRAEREWRRFRDSRKADDTPLVPVVGAAPGVMQRDGEIVIVSDEVPEDDGL